MFENRRYVIFNVSELPLVDFSKVLEESSARMIRSLDLTKTIVKWEGETPDFVNNLTTKEGIYTLEEIWEILKDPEWTNPNPIP